MGRAGDFVGKIVQTACQHQKIRLVLLNTVGHLSRHDVDLIIPCELFYVLDEVVPRSTMSVKLHIWIPANYNQIADPEANESLVA